MKALIIISLVLVFFKGCGEEKNINQGLDAVGIPSSHAEFKHSYTTPFGVKVKSTVEVPDEALYAIEQGILMQIDRLNRLRPLWVNHRSPSQYAVLLIDPMATNQYDEPGSPAILIKGIQSAGTVIGFNGDAGMEQSYIVVPHQEAQGWRFINYLRMSVHNESEHDRECNEPSPKDPSPECYKFQGAFDHHPHKIEPLD